MKFHNLKTCLLTLIRRQNQPYRRQLSATTLRCSRDLPADGPGLRDFIKPSHPQFLSVADDTPYLQVFRGDGRSRKVFFEVYGCQMNVNDTEIVWSILKGAGFVKTDDIQSADVILLMTCSIRDNAEKKIWNRLTHLAALKRERVKHKRKPPMRIGILGCMAERLKTAILEKEQFVDLVAGPDSYKDLPRLLSIADDNQKAINVILSQDETYADVTPVRLNENSITAYVSIMRGCDNMCTYCIVPFTRGRERSRPIDSILSEVKSLSEQGVKEVTLLGQNVNSYRDLSRGGHHDEPTHHPKGFKTVYKPKKGGLRFADLLSEVASVDPQMRIRFTSPHPKDFPDDVLEVMSQRPNLCCNIHLPAQSGSNTVLDRMRRGYTREAYLELVHHIRDRLPGVTLSSDFICGFCGETDEEFAQTLTLLETVKYNVAYLFAYSMREKTTAHRRYLDDVPPSVKNDRLQEMVRVFRREADVANRQFLGKSETVLIEGPSKRSNQFLAGRNDGNIKVIVPDVKVPKTSEMRAIKPGDYIAVQITETNSQVLKGEPMRHTRLLET